MPFSTLIHMYKYKKEQSRQCVWEVGGRGEGKMRCIVSAAGEEKRLSGLWFLAAAAAWEMCVNTTQRHKLLLRGGGGGASLYPCSASRRCLCHKQECSQGVVCVAFSRPAQTTTSHLCYLAVRLFICRVGFFFLLFFLLCCCKISVWSKTVFSGFEGCFSRGNSTAASNPAVCNILSWPCWMYYIRSETFLLQEHSSLFLSQKWFHLLLA